MGNKSEVVIENYNSRERIRVNKPVAHLRLQQKEERDKQQLRERKRKVHINLPVLTTIPVIAHNMH